MTDDISKLCSDYLRQGFAKLKASHARELVAAFFGYKSHAALLSEPTYKIDLLDQSAILIPAVSLIDHRRTCLADLAPTVGAGAIIAEKLIAYLQDKDFFAGEVWDGSDIATFMRDEYLPGSISGHLDNYLAAEIAETNAYFDNHDYTKALIEENANSLIIKVEGIFYGEMDPDRDRMFSGDTIDFLVSLELQRVAGRVAFMPPEIDVTGSVRRDYYDEEPDDDRPVVPGWSPKEPLAPSYESLMNRHNITSVMGGSDLALDLQTMDMKLNRHGNIMWQGKAHDAMFHFINQYIANWPKLHKSFAEIANSHGEEYSLVEAQNKHADELAQKMLRNEEFDGGTMHALSNQRGGLISGQEISAGAVFVVLNSMLDELQKDLGIDDGKFASSGPYFANQSFGDIVWAASNNFRHAEEWRAQWVAERAFENRQLQSIRVLAAVLGIEENELRSLAGNVCPAILEKLSGGNLDELERNLFMFANKLAEGVENEKGLSLSAREGN